LVHANVSGAGVRRYDLEDVKAHGYCGLLPSQIETMKVEDGYTELQLFLGGFRAWIHVTGAVLWLAPQLVLLLRALALSIAGGMLGTKVVSIPIGLQLWGYIKSGRFSPVATSNGGWEYPFDWLFFLVWLLLAVYNLSRLALVYYVKHLEHRYQVKGFHPLVEADKGVIGWALRYGRLMVYGSLGLATYHFLVFLTRPYPALLS
jgi:hypothetical protein